MDKKQQESSKQQEYNFENTLFMYVWRKWKLKWNKNENFKEK